jgi:phage-related tail fiber protein
MAPGEGKLVMRSDILDFSSKQRATIRWGIVGGVVVAALGIGVAIAATPLHAWISGDALNASDLNGNFQNLQAQIEAVVPAGTVTAFAGPVAPSGWLLCDGSVVSRATYANLFAAVGTTSGNGDGATTFNLPDYRGRFLRGVDGDAGVDPDKAGRTAGQGGGSTGDAVGSVQGGATARNGLALSDLGHWHNVDIGGGGGGNLVVSGSGSVSGQDLGFGGLGTGNEYMDTNTVTSNVSLGTGDSETRPVNVYVNYIVKY